MEKTREEILAEIRQQLAELKSQVADMENRLAALEGEATTGAEAAEAVEVIDDAMMAISLDDIMDIDIAAEAPVDEEPAAEQPVAEEPAAAEPVAEEQVAEEPAAEEAAIMELAAEHVTEEPVVEEPATEEVADDEIDAIFGPEPELVAELVMEAEPEPAMEPEPIIEDMPMFEPEPVAEPEPLIEIEPEPVVVAEPEIIEEPILEPEPAPVVEEEPSFTDIFGMPIESDEGTINAKHRATQKKAVNDVMATDEAWRKDMPGSAVRDVRSAISLNDRILFIRVLFDENPESFQEMISAVNGMDNLDEAVAYIKDQRPEWDYNSDTVYRFMMAIRRKIR